jgi:hypothetical protein
MSDTQQKCDMRRPTAAEAANAARRKCGEPSERMRAPALEGDMQQHVAYER